MLPHVKDSNTIILQNHGVVCFDKDLEHCYYKLEIVDAYARILLLAKQIGSIQPIQGDQMKELLQLKGQFGMSDPRVAGGLDKLTCAADFLSRVGGEVATKGRVATETGTAPSPTAAGTTQQQPELKEEEFEQMVQIITDQIMAAV
jgi:L-fuculose-phosphate aldolase